MYHHIYSVTWNKLPINLRSTTVDCSLSVFVETTSASTFIEYIARQAHQIGISTSLSGCHTDAPNKGETAVYTVNDLGGNHSWSVLRRLPLSRLLSTQCSSIQFGVLLPLSGEVLTITLQYHII